MFASWIGPQDIIGFLVFYIWPHTVYNTTVVLYAVLPWHSNFLLDKYFTFRINLNIFWLCNYDIFNNTVLAIYIFCKFFLTSVSDIVLNYSDLGSVALKFKVVQNLRLAVVTYNMTLHMQVIDIFQPA